MLEQRHGKLVPLEEDGVRVRDVRSEGGSEVVESGLRDNSGVSWRSEKRAKDVERSVRKMRC